MSYLFRSEFVVTNSFHGTAFSVISGKKARIVPHSLYNERIESLMNDLDVLPDGNGVYELSGDEIGLLPDKISYSKDVVKQICEE